MKKIFTIAFIILAGFATKSHAQGFKLGLGLEGALPLGSLKDYYNVGAGLTIRGAIGIDASSAVTITTGAIAFIPKDLSNVGLDTKAQLNIPIKAGYKYKFGGPFYGIAEAGATIVRSYFSDANGNLQSIGSTHFTYAPGIGVDLGGFDASIRYEGYQGQGFMGLRIGFNF
ncbi:hypothetical protein [Mucilaginibacter sp. 10I4]|uniref:hypothetical protein n=1 Tax=Mucilaginibacter sp. 10I4 TaxID=3048580 RepID=UPI002B22F84B|nr:hypothetical protein [Mucilaginibacter sp. 10I4]MEB0260895.1 hypothetical protein [Mucilaginibacter sp. 10I4]